MQLSNIEIRPSKAALLAAIGYLMMLATPFSEFFALPKIITSDGATTVKNIVEQQFLFRMGITGYLVNFAGDILAAWALYILLKPVNSMLSLFAFGLRLIYTLISLSALLNLITVLAMTRNPGQYDSLFLNNQVIALISAFRNGWNFAYIFFGLYLILLGYLMFWSRFIPKWIGVSLILAGLGWLVYSLQPLLYPHVEINFLIVAMTGLAELALLLWLCIKGIRLKSFAQE